ncbi:MAG: hypothetical protein KDD14_08760, partial [Saprospiraceae bacterium]|nr:hypothetical protein [Saprospiraceae bacterium]
MFLAQHFCPDVLRFQVQWLGSGIVAFVAVQDCQVDQARGIAGMFLTQRFCPDVLRFQIQWLGFGIVAFLSLQV